LRPGAKQAAGPSSLQRLAFGIGAIAEWKQFTAIALRRSESQPDAHERDARDPKRGFPGFPGFDVSAALHQRRDAFGVLWGRRIIDQQAEVRPAIHRERRNFEGERAIYRVAAVFDGLAMGAR
jgi:hypothetical protein